MITPPPTIGDLVPHDAPMLVLEGLTAWAPGEADCCFTIRPDTPFVEDGQIASVCALEWMGQAIAACLGNEAFQGGGAVRVGMIIGCPRLELLQPQVATGTTVTVRARRVRGSEVVSRFRCEVIVQDAASSSTAQLEPGTGALSGEYSIPQSEYDGKLIATGELTVYHAEAPPQ